MFKVTPDAAKQILAAAEEGNMTHLALRIAARKNTDGSIEYGMSFDQATDDDVSFTCEGIEIIVDRAHEPLLAGATLDFVALEPGEYQFVFRNPNDPGYVPHGGSCSSSGGGCGGCRCG